MSFRSLLTTERPLVLPGAHDAISALLIKRAGFKAFFTGGFPLIGARFGLPDIGLVALGEISTAVRDILAVSDLPAMVDIDNGYGDVKNVVHVLHTYERLGAQAIMLEDQVAPKRCGHIAGKDVVPTEQMVAKVRAAAQSRLNPDTFILARTDARDVLGLDEAYRRAERYLAAGADGLFIESPHDVGELAADRPQVRRPANGEHAGRRPHPDPEAGRARRARVPHGGLRHLAADAFRPHDAGRAREPGARRRELHRQGRRVRGIQIDRRLRHLGRHRGRARRALSDRPASTDSDIGRLWNVGPHRPRQSDLMLAIRITVGPFLGFGGDQLAEVSGTREFGKLRDEPSTEILATSGSDRAALISVLSFE